VKRIAELVLRVLGRESLGVAHAPERPYDVHRHLADISLARKLLGYAPTFSIEDGIRRYIDWVRGSAQDPRVLLAQQESAVG
jgi:nucleoside-diphosphate-sugar epimerase